MLCSGYYLQNREQREDPLLPQIHLVEGDYSSYITLDTPPSLFPFCNNVNDLVKVLSRSLLDLDFFF